MQSILSILQVGKFWKLIHPTLLSITGNLRFALITSPSASILSNTCLKPCADARLVRAFHFRAWQDNLYKLLPTPGSSWFAFSPVNTTLSDFSFNELILLRKTFWPKGCMCLRQLVWINTLVVPLRYRFKTLRSSWAEFPSKSPRNLRWRFSLFLWTEILKFVAITSSFWLLKQQKPDFHM